MAFCYGVMVNLKVKLTKKWDMGIVFTWGKTCRNTLRGLFYNCSEQVWLWAASFLPGRKFQSGVGGWVCGGHVCSSPLCGFCSANQTTCLKDSGIQELSASASQSTYSAAACDKLFSVFGGGLKTLSIHNAAQRSLPSFSNLLPPAY